MSMTFKLPPQILKILTGFTPNSANTTLFVISVLLNASSAWTYIVQILPVLFLSTKALMLDASFTNSVWIDAIPQKPLYIQACICIKEKKTKSKQIPNSTVASLANLCILQSLRAPTSFSQLANFRNLTPILQISITK